MTTLADIRGRVRKDLGDTAAGAYRWTDDQLDRHIERALDELSRAIPREQVATVATTAGSREVDLSGLTGLIEVESVEYPVDSFPPEMTGFSTWADSLTLHVERLPDGGVARIYYTARHVLDGSGSTLPSFLEDVLAAGAGAFAALEAGIGGIDRLNTGGPDVAKQYESWGRARLTAFRQLLHQQGRSNRVRVRRLYLPA